MPSYVIPPAGVTAASFFTPVVVDAAKPPVILADDIDPQTKELRSLFSGVHPIDAALQCRFTADGNAGPSLANTGNKFRAIRKNVEGAEQQIKNEAKRLVQKYVDANDIEIEQLAVDATTYPDMGAVFIKYRNLRTGKPGRISR